jgi:hypothetical protein
LVAQVGFTSGCFGGQSAGVFAQDGGTIGGLNVVVPEEVEEPDVKDPAVAFEENEVFAVGGS